VKAIPANQAGCEADRKI